MGVTFVNTELQYKHWVQKGSQDMVIYKSFSDAFRCLKFPASAYGLIEMVTLSLVYKKHFVCVENS